MTQQRLEQYRAMKREIAGLEKQVSALEGSRTMVADSVKASTLSFPYISYTLPIRGYDPKTEQQLARLNARLDALYAELAAIEAFILGLEDSLVRQIIELRYIQGKTWLEVSSGIYGWPDKESTVRMRLKRFFK